MQRTVFFGSLRLRHLSLIDISSQMGVKFVQRSHSSLKAGRFLLGCRLSQQNLGAASFSKDLFFNVMQLGLPLNHRLSVFDQALDQTVIKFRSEYSKVGSIQPLDGVDVIVSVSMRRKESLTEAQERQDVLEDKKCFSERE